MPAALLMSNLQALCGLSSLSLAPIFFAAG